MILLGTANFRRSASLVSSSTATCIVGVACGVGMFSLVAPAATENSGVESGEKTSSTLFLFPFPFLPLPLSSLLPSLPPPPPLPRSPSLPPSLFLCLISRFH